MVVHGPRRLSRSLSQPVKGNAIRSSDGAVQRWQQPDGKLAGSQARAALDGLLEQIQGGTGAGTDALPGGFLPTRLDASDADIGADLSLYDAEYRVAATVITAAAAAAANSGALPAPLLRIVSPYRAHLQEIRQVGKGGFGTVVMALNRLDNSIVALKRIAFTSAVPPWAPAEVLEAAHARLLREVRALTSLQDSPYVVKYRSAWIEPHWERLARHLAGSGVGGAAGSGLPPLARPMKEAAPQLATPPPSPSRLLMGNGKEAGGPVKTQPAKDDATAEAAERPAGRQNRPLHKRQMSVGPQFCSYIPDLDTIEESNGPDGHSGDRDPQPAGLGAFRPAKRSASVQAEPFNGGPRGYHRTVSAPMLDFGFDALQRRLSPEKLARNPSICIITEEGESPAPTRNDSFSAAAAAACAEEYFLGSNGSAMTETGLAGAQLAGLGAAANGHLAGARFGPEAGASCVAAANGVGGAVLVGPLGGCSEELSPEPCSEPGCSGPAISKGKAAGRLPGRSCSSDEASACAAGLHHSQHITASWPVEASSDHTGCSPFAWVAGNPFTPGGSDLGRSSSSSSISSRGGSGASTPTRRGSGRPLDFWAATSSSSVSSSEATSLTISRVPSTYSELELPLDPFRRPNMLAPAFSGPASKQHFRRQSSGLSFDIFERDRTETLLEDGGESSSDDDSTMLRSTRHVAREDSLPPELQRQLSPMKPPPPPPGRNGSGPMNPARPWPYTLYIAMDMVMGPTLDAWIRRRNQEGGPIDGVVECAIFEEIVLGLAHIHMHGLIHRDIKPANIFVLDHGASPYSPGHAPQPLIQLCDFGLAVVSDMAGPWGAGTGGLGQPGFADSSAGQVAGGGIPRAASTSSGSSSQYTAGVGTASYCAPEQLHGNGQYSASADIFPLGLILVELLCPFGTGMERAAALLQARAGRAPTAMHEAFPAQALLAEWLLLEDPAQRPSVQELLHRLGRCTLPMMPTACMNPINGGPCPTPAQPLRPGHPTGQANVVIADCDSKNDSASPSRSASGSPTHCGGRTRSGSQTLSGGGRWPVGNTEEVVSKPNGGGRWPDGAAPHCKGGAVAAAKSTEGRGDDVADSGYQSKHVAGNGLGDSGDTCTSCSEEEDNKARDECFRDVGVQAGSEVSHLVEQQTLDEKDSQIAELQRQLAVAQAEILRLNAAQNS